MSGQSRAVGRFGCGVNCTLDKKFVGKFTRLKVVRTLRRRNVEPRVLSKMDTNTLTTIFCTSNGRPCRVIRLFRRRSFGRLAAFSVGGRNLLGLSDFVSFLGDGLRSGAVRRLGVPAVVATASLSRKHVISFGGKGVTRELTTSYYVPVLFTPVHVGGACCMSKKVLVGLPIDPVHGRYRGIVTLGMSPLMTSRCDGGIMDVTLETCRFVFRTGALPRGKVTSLLVRSCKLRRCDGERLRETRRVFRGKCGATARLLSELLLRGKAV